MRLDKFLANMGIGTRSEVKVILKQGRVRVNDEKPSGPEMKIDEKKDSITVDGEPVNYVENVYLMLHKPQGVITATEDKVERTVMDLISIPEKKNLFPVGRLDKDTEGLLLITDDGALAHMLLSPRKHVGKVYCARIEGRVTPEDVEAFKKGVKISSDFEAMPANLKILSAGEVSEIEVEIFEGKFHQVKRMFEAVGKRVIYLKRLSMGTLILDENLQIGEYRKLTKEEIDGLKTIHEQK